MILGILLMFLEPFYKQIGITGVNLISWFVIFIISYPSYVGIRKDYLSSNYYLSKQNNNLKRKE
jgi:hypothetical protein